LTALAMSNVQPQILGRRHRSPRSQHDAPYWMAICPLDAGVQLGTAR
jgi:hypothetical protein